MKMKSLQEMEIMVKLAQNGLISRDTVFKELFVDLNPEFCMGEARRKDYEAFQQICKTTAKRTFGTLGVGLVFLFILYMVSA